MECKHGSHPGYGDNDLLSIIAHLSERVEVLETENGRMLFIMERINKMSGDMLETERRRGPGGRVRKLQKDGELTANDEQGEHSQVSVGVSDLSGD